jgi:hypothetical protein
VHSLGPFGTPYLFLSHLPLSARVAGCRSHASPVGASRVASDLLVQACRRPYPGRTDEAGSLVPPEGSVPSSTSAFPRFAAGRLLHHPFRGLLGVPCRCGLSARQVAQGNPLHRGLPPLRYLHYRPDCYRAERFQVPGRESHPLKTDTFSRRTRRLG